MLKLVVFLFGFVGVVVGAPNNVNVIEYSEKLILWENPLYEQQLTASQNLTRTLPDGRIVGGKDANITDYPYTASFQFASSHRCGAAIVSTTWVLSAAHCLISGVFISLYSIRAGSSTRNSGGTVYSISRILIHGDYGNLDFDIIAIETDSAITAINSGAAPLPPAGSGPSAGLTTAITGWGATSEGGPSATILQVVEVPTISQASCQTFYGSSLTARMFCAGLVGVGGKDACQGDSGGPLAINGVLYGLVSWGNGCARPDGPGVYTNVPALRSWITSTTGL